MSASIHVRGVFFSYQGEKGVRKVFEDLNLEIPSGSFCCAVGPSGCGKTTLLKLIGGFIRPDAGSLTIGENPIRKPGRERIMIFQEFDQLFPWMTILGNLIFPLIHSPGKRAGDRRELKKLAQSHLELTGIADCAHLYPYQLSGGMKQRAAIARALMLRPEVLLMDEPFGSLDHELRGELQRLMLRVSRETRATILFVTHDIGEAVLLSDHILKVSKGGAERLENSLERPRSLHGKGEIAMIARLIGQD
jgi:NitT/TauT family transport system ATP-binding protein